MQPTATFPAPAFAEIRPMFNYGDHCVVSSLEDAEYIGVYTSDGLSPSSRHEIYDDFRSALDETKSLNPQRIWYNGNEILTEIKSVDDLYVKLGEVYCFENDDDDLAGWLQAQLGFSK